MDNEYVLLDTSAFERAIAQKDKLTNEYRALNDDYDRIVRELSENWKGRGAEAFQKSAKDIRTNIASISDILDTMMQTLIDCKTIFEEYDRELGKYNENPA